MFSLRRRRRIWKNTVLPPADLTPCGRLTDTPERFYQSACEEARRLAAQLGLVATSRILDIGCGVGRLPIGMLAIHLAFRSYVGIDVDRRRINWCTRHLARGDKRLHFVHIDMQNPRYNRSGRGVEGPDLGESVYDIVYLYSVFSHLLPPDITTYLALIAKHLDPEGHCFLTIFVADGVPDCTENPREFGQLEWSGPLHCVLYDRKYWYALVRAAGLQIVSETVGVNIDGQTGYVLKKVPSKSAT
jgi:SAM-dependent methyltransferase